MEKDKSVDSLIEKLKELAISLYPEIVIDTEIIYGKLRIYIIDGSFIDIWISRRLLGRYAIHWERRHIDGTIYRWDNTPHEVHKNISTFPHHFHEKVDHNVKPFHYPRSMEETIIRILEYVKRKIK